MQHCCKKRTVNVLPTYYLHFKAKPHQKLDNEGAKQGSSIPSSRFKVSFNPVIPMVIFGIPCILSISNLAYCFVLKSRIPNPESRIPNPGLQKRRILHPDKPIGETRQWISFFRVLSMSRSQWGSGTTKKSTVNSLLTDTCLRRTPGVGLCRFSVNYTRLIQQQDGKVSWRRESAQKGLNTTSGAQFPALPLVKPVV